MRSLREIQNDNPEGSCVHGRVHRCTICIDEAQDNIENDHVNEVPC